ncbi:MAG TPA: glycosyltransferase family 2 protein [Bryobacteraceae bacterium]|nr:glycosyltransferase family 2 protein [Bryobacteraceae bacterium]
MSVTKVTISTNDSADELSPEFAAFLPEAKPDKWDLPLKLIIVAALALLVMVNIRYKAFIPLVGLAESHGISAMLVRPSILWFGMGSLLLVFRTFLWFTYRPHGPATLENAPRMTVIIPAYNEGPMVARSIDSVANANYPPDRLEIIVVDDGSKDDTWLHIQDAVARHGDRVRAIRLDRNQGKREALAAGFRRGKGEIFVTVDSDSVVGPNALLALAGPFADERIGVVAGRVLVYNRHEGLIPRMLHVRFTLSFDFLRAYQSTFGTVYCSPGALSGYRASAVKMVLEPWLKQEFLGARATIGEDRALTNDIMRLGYDSVYQRRATVLTIVPVTYGKLCRMLLRWDRSYVREELRFATIVWKRPPVARMIAVLDSAITNLRYPVMLSTFLLLGAAFYHDPRTLLRVLAAVGLVSCIYSLFYLRSERSFNIVYGIVFEYFSFFFLFWIFPWAVLTVRVRGWLTR